MKRSVFYVIVVSAISFACCYAYSHVTQTIEKVCVDAEVVVPRVFNTTDTVFNGRYTDTFNDIQEIQVIDAEAYGITPLMTSDSVEMLIKEGKLVNVPDCQYYETDEADHPYLTPSAKDLLDEIARRYQKLEKSNKQLRLTSCLRTQQAISKLMRRNVNSIKNSCHLYGTTFDISYRYMSHKEKRNLAQVLFELQQAGYCYVKYERKQPCFHITVRF